MPIPLRPIPLRPIPLGPTARLQATVAPADPSLTGVAWCTWCWVLHSCLACCMLHLYVATRPRRVACCNDDAAWHESVPPVASTPQRLPLHKHDGVADCTGSEATLLGILPKKRKFAAHVASLEDVPERAVSAGRTLYVAR